MYTERQRRVQYFVYGEAFYLPSHWSQLTRPPLYLAETCLATQQRWKISTNYCIIASCSHPTTTTGSSPQWSIHLHTVAISHQLTSPSHSPLTLITPSPGLPSPSQPKQTKTWPARAMVRLVRREIGVACTMWTPTRKLAVELRYPPIVWQAWKCGWPSRQDGSLWGDKGWEWRWYDRVWGWIWDIILNWDVKRDVDLRTLPWLLLGK